MISDLEISESSNKLGENNGYLLIVMYTYLLCDMLAEHYGMILSSGNNSNLEYRHTKIVLHILNTKHINLSHSLIFNLDRVLNEKC